jgi:hypothetical protein
MTRSVAVHRYRQAPNQRADQHQVDEDHVRHRQAHHTFYHRRKDERAPTQRDLHDAFGTACGVKSLVGFTVFKYSRPNIKTL